MIKHTLEWFQNRIGKKIFRNKTSCKCETCERGKTNGVIITDNNHAEYLHMVQFDLDINYRDKK